MYIPLNDSLSISLNTTEVLSNSLSWSVAAADDVGHAMPFVEQCLKVGVKFRHFLTFCHSANYHAEVVWFNALYEKFESPAFFAALDFLRY